MTHRCPDEETLAAFFDGLLPPAAEESFLRGLRTCDDCLELVAALGIVIDADDGLAWREQAVPAEVTRRALDLWPVEDDALRRGLRIAVKWIGDALRPLTEAMTPLPPMATAVRGGDDAPREELRYQVTLGDLPLEIDLEIDGPDELALTIRPIHPPPAGLLLRLMADGETRALSSLDDRGATVDALPLGHYELSIEQADRPLGSLRLDLLA